VHRVLVDHYDLGETESDVKFTLVMRAYDSSRSKGFFCLLNVAVLDTKMCGH
jgi:hypothetical protein